MRKTIIIISLLILIRTSTAQEINPKYKFENFKKKQLNEKVLNSISINKHNTANVTASKKSPGISLILSILLPGMGHLYAGRMDVGAYFLGAEAAMWLGIGGFTLYGDYLRDDSRSFSVIHAGLNQEGKDDDYFSNVGNYLSIYDYNNEKLQFGEFDKIYDINTHYWNWDAQNNQAIFNAQRKKSERTYNNRIIFATGLIINRIVSGISSIILTNEQNKLTSGVKLNSSFISTPEQPFDGIKISLSKEF